MLELPYEALLNVTFDAPLESRCCQIKILVLTSLFSQQNIFKHKLKLQVGKKKKKKKSQSYFVAQLKTRTDTLYLSI